MKPATPASPKAVETRVVAENRQARHKYFIEDTMEAGIILQGWEVKAILGGQATFNAGSAYIRLQDGRAWLTDLTITPMPQALKSQLDKPQPMRERELLLNRSELNKLGRRVREDGYTVVPLALSYGRKLKLKIGLAKGKKLVDKKETIKARDLERQTQRELSTR